MLVVALLPPLRPGPEAPPPVPANPAPVPEGTVRRRPRLCRGTAASLEGNRRREAFAYTHLPGTSGGCALAGR